MMLGADGELCWVEVIPLRYCSEVLSSSFVFGSLSILPSWLQGALPPHTAQPAAFNFPDLPSVGSTF